MLGNIALSERALSDESIHLLFTEIVPSVTVTWSAVTHAGDTWTEVTHSGDSWTDKNV